jgi:hypothetical protein
MAAVQREFGLPAALVDGLVTAARRPVLELTGELLLMVVETTTWVAAWPPAPSTAAAERLKQRYAELRAHLLHLVALAEGLANLLSSALQANLTEVSVRQYDDMRRISAWVAIWAVPT